MENIDDLMMRALEIKRQKQALEDELNDIGKKISAAARFPEGKHTAHVEGLHARATVSIRTSEKWDQKKLNNARSAVGDDVFLKAFRFEWKKRSNKELNLALSGVSEEQRKLVLSALSTTKNNYITYEDLDA